MYCPSHFQEHRTEVLLDLIKQYPLATVVALENGDLSANHIPLMYEAAEGTAGKLIGHVAKSNPLWQAAPEHDLLIIFGGPSAYISPNLYATKAESGKVVPTWNYAAVHVHATLKAVHDPARVRKVLDKLTDWLEASQPRPWSVSDAPQDYIDCLLGHIVVIELHIKRMQGKWKVSQNQPAENKCSVATGLYGLQSEPAAQMAALISEFAEKRD